MEIYNQVANNNEIGNNIGLENKIVSRQVMQGICCDQDFDVYQMQQKQYQTYCLEYSGQPSQLIKWIRIYVRQIDVQSYEAMREFILNINNQPAGNTVGELQRNIRLNILSNGNYLGNLIKKGFLYYLFKKYELYNYTDNTRFVEEFERDINWFKNYFCHVIVNVYRPWIGNQPNQIRTYFHDFGVVQILTQFPEWEIIFAIFNKCLPKYRHGLNRQDMEFYYNSIIRQNQMNVDLWGQNIPFHNTIQFLKEFCQAKSILNKMNRLKRLDQLLKSQIRQKILPDLERDEEVDENTKLKHLQYCIFASNKEVIKSVVYIEVLIGKENLDSKSRFRQSKFILKSLYDASYVLLCEYCESYKQLNASKKYISFRLPTVLPLAQLPFALSSIQSRQIFSTMGNSKVVLFSLKSLIIDSFIKIQFTSEDNDLSIGVCDKKKFENEKNLLTSSQHAIVFNTKNKRMYHNHTHTEQKIDEHIYRITLLVKNSTDVQWIINDIKENKRTIKCKYNRLVQSMDQMYACICFKKGTQFSIVQY